MRAQAYAQTDTHSRNKGLGWLLDFETFARSLVWIRAKDEQLIKLKANPMQRAWERQAAGAKRTVTLKARQHGISTWIEARMYWRACTREGYRGVIIAQDKESTTRLRQKIGLMHQQHALHSVAPKARFNSKAELSFDELGSTIYIGTAGARAFGRGDTISEVHASELAFWPDPARILTGLLEAVPQGGEIHIESTANGFNYFHDLVQEARAGQGHWRSIFLPWFMNPEYRRWPGVPQSDWDESEHNLARIAAAYGIVISNEQIAFRREKQRDTRGMFAQEYAETPETCFLLSGRPRYDMTIMSRMLADAKAPARVKEFNDCQLTYREWAAVEPGTFYVIGADAAQGISDRDYSCGCVVDWETGQQVAELHGRADPSVFADKLALIAMQYNNAVINPERKESGIAVVSKLKEMGYPRLFYYLDEKGALADQPGFDTNTHTKPIAVEMVGELMSDYAEAFVNREEIAELMRFVVTANGKTEAEPGAHDDRVAARWCAEMARRQVRPPRTEPLPRRKVLGAQR